MSFRIPHDPRLLAAHKAMAALLAHAIVIDRHRDFESDDQGGTHTIHGMSVALAEESEGREPLIFWDRTQASHLEWFEADKKARLAHMLGCKVEDLMLPQHAPAFFPALDALRLGMSVSCVYEPYEVDPVGVPA